MATTATVDYNGFKVSIADRDVNGKRSLHQYVCVSSPLLEGKSLKDLDGFKVPYGLHPVFIYGGTLSLALPRCELIELPDSQAEAVGLRRFESAVEKFQEANAIVDSMIKEGKSYAEIRKVVQPVRADGSVLLKDSFLLTEKINKVWVMSPSDITQPTQHFVYDDKSVAKGRPTSIIDGDVRTSKTLHPDNTQTFVKSLQAFLLSV